MTELAVKPERVLARQSPALKVNVSGFFIRYYGVVGYWAVQ